MIFLTGSYVVVCLVAALLVRLLSRPTEVNGFRQGIADKLTEKATRPLPR